MIKKILASMLLITISTHSFAVDNAVVQTINDAPEVAFPDLKKSYLKEFPRINIDDAFNLSPGMSKETVRKLVGNPHFSEFSPKTWNYVFNIHHPYSYEYTICQAQISFQKDTSDNNKLISDRVVWAPEYCRELINSAIKKPLVQPPVIIQPPVVQPLKAESRRFILPSDFLFKFDSNKLKASSIPMLQKLKSDINNSFTQILSLEVVGHADRLGADDYNLKLSERRAVEVLTELSDISVPVSSVSGKGKGETEPKTHGCWNEGNVVATKACLAPDRRVDIIINGIPK